MRIIYSKAFRKFLAIFVLVAALIILDATGYLAVFKGEFFKVYGFFVAPVHSSTQTVKTFFSTAFTIKNLVKENAQLNQKIDELTFDNARLQTALTENSSLRQALGLKERSKLNLIPAEVISLDPSGFTQTILINKGTDSGIKEAQALIVAPGLLVGRITKVYAGASSATLITDPSSIVNAQVVDSGARGLIRGEHGLSLLFDLLTQNELIKPGDTVVTSDLSGDFPPGLLIGEVVGISSSPSELFQKAYVSAAADLRNLKFVFVIGG